MDFVERNFDLVQAAYAAEEREFVVGRTDHVLRLTKASWVPATAHAQHATNALILTIYKGPAGTALATLNNHTGASYVCTMVKGVPNDFTLTATGKDLEFDEDDVLELAATAVGAGASADGSLHLEFQPRRI